MSYKSDVFSGQWEYFFSYLDVFAKKYEQFKNPEEGST